MESAEVRQWFHGLRNRGVRLFICLVLAACGSLVMIPEAFSKKAKGCNSEPTGVETSDYGLDFQVPIGLMPDPQFAGRDATIRVHRVKPIYAKGKCNGVPNLAVVLVHGRSVPGSATFDLRHPTPEDPEGGALSLQEALARAGIDTFAPDLLGYGLSTRFEDGLDDPCNASLPAYNADGSCSFAEGCDRSRNTGIFPLNQQTRYLGDGLLPAIDGLGVNPLGGQRCAHSSPYRFSRTDVWARDVMQVIEDAIAKAQPRGKKVVLVGSSFGGPTTARTLYLLGEKAERKVRRAVFLSSLFNRLPGVPVEVNLPTEEKDLSPTELSTSFPLALSRLGGWSGIPSGRESFCSGRVVPGTPEESRQQLLDLDPLGASWGGSDPENPTGLLRSPTFTNYGWNRDVAATFTLPTLILHGADDTTSPPLNSNNIFDALTSVSNKLLVQVECGSHQLHQEGCSGDRCDDRDPNTIPYGQSSPIWAGPHSTIAAALIEWVKYGTFNSSECGHFIVNASGVASDVGTPNCSSAP